MWSEFKSDVCRLLFHARNFVRDHRRKIALYLIAGALITLAVGQSDYAVRDYYAPFQQSEYRKVAITIRRLGDIYDVLFYCGLLYFLGIWRGKRSWRAYAAAALLGACLAGLTVNVIRISTGRARPHTGRTDWIGPTLFQYRMQSFPSGHTGTSLGMSSTLIQLFPVLGVPALAGSVAIGWASIAAHKHYPSDVAGAVTIGVLSGVTFAAAARRRMRELSAEGPAS